MLKEDFVQRALPLSWLRFSDELAAIAAGNATVSGNEAIEGEGEGKVKQPVLSLREVKVVAGRCGVEAAHVLQVLRLLHQLGSLVFYDEPALRDLVVLEPQWLVMAVARVIRDYDLHAVQKDREARALGSQWLMLTKEGQLTKPLLDLLWAEYTGVQRRVLLALLLKFGLACPLPNYEGQPIYLVPSVLPSKALPNSAPPAVASFATLKTTLSNKLPFLPEALWARLLVKCAQFDAMLRASGGTSGSSSAGSDAAGGGSVQLSRGWAYFSFGGRPFLLRRDEATQSIAIEIGIAYPTPIAQTLLQIATDTCAEWLPELTASLEIQLLQATFDLKQLLNTFDAPPPDDEAEEAKELDHEPSVPHPTDGRHLHRVDFLPWVRPQTEAYYDVYISYRQASEGPLAQLLFHDLSNRTIGDEGRQVRVFLDRVRLSRGQRWDAGFAHGLATSAVCVPLMSYGAVQRMELLDPDGGIDFHDATLLEWMLTLELHAQGRLKAVQPILIGKIKPDGAMSDYLEDGSKGLLKDAVSQKTLGALRKVAKQLEPPLQLSAEAEARTISATRDAMLAFPTTPWHGIASAPGSSPFHREAASIVFGQVRFLAARSANGAPVATAVFVDDDHSAYPPLLEATTVGVPGALPGGMPAAVPMGMVLDEMPVAIPIGMPNVPMQLGVVGHGVLGVVAKELGMAPPPPMAAPPVEGLTTVMTGCRLEAYVPAAESWCAEMGVFSVEMLMEVGMHEEMIAALELKPAQAKLLKMRLEKGSKGAQKLEKAATQPVLVEALSVEAVEEPNAPPEPARGGCCLIL